MIHCSVCVRRETTSAPTLMLFKKERKIEMKRTCKTIVNLLSAQKVASIEENANFDFVGSQLPPSQNDADLVEN